MPNEIRHVNQKFSLAGYLFPNCLHQIDTNSQIYITNHSGSIACFVNYRCILYGKIVFVTNPHTINKISLNEWRRGVEKNRIISIS